MHMRSQPLTFNTQVSGEQATVHSAVETMLPQSVLLVLVLFSSLLWPGSQKEESHQQLLDQPVIYSHLYTQKLKVNEELANEGGGYS